MSRHRRQACRAGVIGLALLTSSATAQAPTAVTYLLGGAVSGPYRVAADLAAGTVSEARPPTGVRGDGAGVSAVTLPETSRRALTPAEQEAIAGLAAAVLRDGVSRGRDCPPTASAVVRIIVAAGPAGLDETAAAPCLTPAAASLRDALVSASRRP